MIRETQQASKIYTELKEKHSCFVFNISGFVFQKAGMPDALLVKDTHHIWIECKNIDEPVKPIQEAVHRELAKQGAHVYVLRFITSNYWMIDELFHIKFRLFREGVAELLRVLLELERSRGVQVASSSTKRNELSQYQGDSVQM